MEPVKNWSNCSYFNVFVLEKINFHSPVTRQFQVVHDLLLEGDIVQYCPKGRYLFVHSLGSVRTNTAPRDSIGQYCPPGRDVLENISRMGVSY